MQSIRACGILCSVKVVSFQMVSRAGQALKRRTEDTGYHPGLEGSTGMHIKPLTQTTPAKAASLEAKLDMINQVIGTILATNNLLEELNFKSG